MRENLKVLLILELFVCFAPALVQLFLGLLIIPVGFAMDPSLEVLESLAMVIGGLCGMVGLSVVVAALISGKEPRLSTPVVLLLASLGFASLLPLVVDPGDSSNWRLIGLMPILGGLHVIYLARSILFKVRVQWLGDNDDV
jgi:hypothetical protein